MSSFITFNLTVAKNILAASKREVQKKGLSATPSSTLPWPTKRIQGFTWCKISVWLHHIYIPVVIARPFSALPVRD
jgi:hypothetical protein